MTALTIIDYYTVLYCTVVTITKVTGQVSSITSTSITCRFPSSTPIRSQMQCDKVSRNLRLSCLLSLNCLVSLHGDQYICTI